MAELTEPFTALKSLARRILPAQIWKKRKLRKDKPRVHGVQQAIDLEEAATSPFEPMVPIRRGDGSLVTRFESTPSWKLLKDGTPDEAHPQSEPITATQLLSEDHHRFCGGPWLVGRKDFDQLIACGVKPTDCVLDLGCGAGRVGIWLISYLEAQRYCGVDNHLRSLVAFAAYECLLHNLFPKQPRLMLSNDFEVPGFGVKFDVVLDLHVTTHLPPDRIERAFKQIAPTCRIGGRYITPKSPRLGVDAMRRFGFELTNVFEVHYPLLNQQSGKDGKEWHVFVRT